MELDTIPQIFYQVPLVVLFIWFVLKMREEERKERDAIREERALERREFLASLDRVANQMECVSEKLDKLANVRE